MTRGTIDPKKFTIDIIPAWADRWFLLTAGINEPGKFNTMTVAWGSFGVMWSKPMAQVVVRPSRHTHGFTENDDTFTLSAFPDGCKDALMLCGTKSGRDTDKTAAAGLSPVTVQGADAPGFDEAELIISCRKIYRDTMKPEGFLDEGIEPNYKGSDYHTIYFGEITGIEGTERYTG